MVYDNFFTTPNIKYKKAFTYNVTTEPINLPISLVTVKAYLKLSGSAEDDILTMFIEAAKDFAESYTGRTLINTTFTTFRDDFADDFTLRRSKLQSITSFEYLLDGTLTAVDSSLYGVTDDKDFSSIYEKDGQVFPDLDANIPDSVKIVFVAGYGATDASVPSALKLALLAHIAFMYANRGDCSGDCSSDGGSSLPASVRNMYNKYRILNLGSSDRSYPSDAVGSYGYRL